LIIILLIFFAKPGHGEFASSTQTGSMIFLQNKAKFDTVYTQIKQSAWKKYRVKSHCLLALAAVGSGKQAGSKRISGRG
jgi:hypothetical protein